VPNAGINGNLVRNTQIFILTFLILLNYFDSAQATNIIVDVKTTLIDGSSAPYNQLVAGDTIFLHAGDWDNLLIRNYRGTSGKPIIFINKGGIVRFDTDHNHAISVQNCQFFKITGTGNSEFYGIQVDRVQNGTGIGIGGLSSDFEIDHISIKNVPIAGIYAKTDPDCSLVSVRGNFIQMNTLIHDNYIENAGNEGLYVGNTTYFGQTVNCNGKDTVLLPSLLEGVRIYNNIIKYSGWDGIQVSSAVKECQIFGNQILFDSQAEIPNQMSGIIIGGGSKCDCYNNLIADGKGDGVELHGLGGNRIFNNIIVNAGRTYYPEDYSSSTMKHGIFVSDVSVEPDSSFYIQNNTIINPKSDGIRFSSIKSRHNLIASNAIINPGNFKNYENGNTHFKGVDSYVMIPDAKSDIVISSNYFARDLTNAGLAADCSLLKNSPLIDAGYSSEPAVSFDFKNKPRPLGNGLDIGAFEYDPQTGIHLNLIDESGIIVFPNPFQDELYLKLQLLSKSDLVFSVFSLSGIKILSKDIFGLPSGVNTIAINLNDLNPGIYLYSLRNNKQLLSGKLVKAK